MRASILIVTYAHHAPFCRLLLKSLARYASGFERCLVVVPVADLMKFIDMVCEANGQGGIKIELKLAHEPPVLGHVGQTIAKTYADIWLPEADLITHLDADCVATRVFTPESYLNHANQIVILTRPYADAGDARCWQSHVEVALGENTPLECMQSPALAYWRETYARTRETVERKHAEPFTHYCLRHGCWPEFNGLGHVALTHHAHRYQAIEVDSPEGTAWPRFVFQGWSRAADDPASLPAELARLEAAMGEPNGPAETHRTN